MRFATDFSVRKDDLKTTAVHERTLPALARGEVLLRVSSFALTANNVTYGVVADRAGYWNFFPGPDGFGVIPVWGNATVIESRHPELPVGERLFGLLPMSTHVVLAPGSVSPVMIQDMADRRREMAPFYNRYTRSEVDGVDDQSDDLKALLYPLFTTGLLIEEQCRRADWYEGRSVVVTSASSKTALSLAHVARSRSPNIRRVGLTSPANRRFVNETGLYDEVLTYDELKTLDLSVPTVIVDFAGSAPTLRHLHERLGGALRYSCRVGITDWQNRGAANDLPGPTPVLFFAPTAIEIQAKESGRDVFGKILEDAWRDFARDTQGWLTIEHHKGVEELAIVYRSLLDGRVSPDKGHVCSL